MTKLFGMERCLQNIILFLLYKYILLLHLKVSIPYMEFQQLN